MKEFFITIDGEQTGISETAELLAVLDVLNGEEDNEVLSQLGSSLRQIIRNGKELKSVIQVLSHENRLFLYQQLGENLAEIISEARFLSEILAAVPQKESDEALFGVLGRDGIHKLVKSADDLAMVLEWVYDDCDDLFIEIAGIEFV